MALGETKSVKTVFVFPACQQSRSLVCACVLVYEYVCVGFKIFV